MSSKYIVVLPPINGGGMIVEKVENTEELNHLISKYCGFERFFVNTPLGYEYMVYASSREKGFLPVNLALSWLVGGGVAKNVVECFFGYGVICKFVDGNSAHDSSITGFDSVEIHDVMRKVRELVPSKSFT